MASHLRVGVLTFHRCINYGSYWQARCLVEGLRARGHDAVLLDHHDDAVARAEWRCAFQPSLPERSRIEDLPRYKEKGRKFLAAFDALPQSFANVLWFNPIVHIIGMNRAGVYATYRAEYVQPVYVALVAAVLFQVGLALLYRWHRDLALR